MKNDGYRLPFDVREYVKKKTAAKILLLSALEILIIFFVIFMGELFFSAFALPSRIIIYVILILLPAVLIGRKLIDRPWRGNVIKVDVKTVHIVNDDRGGYTRAGGTGRRVSSQNLLFVLIEKENGNLLEKEYAPQKNTVKVGDRAYHFSGVPHIVYVHDDKKAKIRCGICGTKNEPDGDACWSCGMSLIKPEE